MQQRIISLAGLALCVAGSMLADSRLPGVGQPAVLPANVRPPQLGGVGVDERLIEPIDLSLTFMGETGYPVRLVEFFHKDRPVILNLVYYTCPMLCTLVLNGQVEAMREINWIPGKDYEVVTISIDPRDSFDSAQKKKAIYLGSYDRPAPGWHFLADHQGNVAKLAEQVGFRYRYDKRIEQYAHPAAIMVLTPEGSVARYLYGIRFRSRDLRFALAEASQGRATMALEKLMLFCYQYDPKASSYVLFAANLMRGGGILTVILIALYLRRMFRVDRARMAHLAKEGLA